MRGPAGPGRQPAPSPAAALATRDLSGFVLDLLAPSDSGSESAPSPAESAASALAAQWVAARCTPRAVRPAQRRQELKVTDAGSQDGVAVPVELGPVHSVLPSAEEDTLFALTGLGGIAVLAASGSGRGTVLRSNAQVKTELASAVLASGFETSRAALQVDLASGSLATVSRPPSNAPAGAAAGECVVVMATVTFKAKLASGSGAADDSASAAPVQPNGKRSIVRPPGGKARADVSYLALVTLDAKTLQVVAADARPVASGSAARHRLVPLPSGVSLVGLAVSSGSLDTEVILLDPFASFAPAKQLVLLHQARAAAGASGSAAAESAAESKSRQQTPEAFLLLPRPADDADFPLVRLFASTAAGLKTQPAIKQVGLCGSGERAILLAEDGSFL